MVIPGKHSLKYILLLVFLLLAVTPLNAAAAAPYINSNYYCLMDSSGQIIFSQNADKERPVASTTKMVTAILAMEYAGLEEIAVVSENADRTPEFTIGLSAGQEISIRELLNVALMRSSNDAAVVLAEHVAGNEELFAHLMSLKAFLIGAMNTHFANASGLPNNNHYSTAYDLGQIGRYLLANDYLSQVVATKLCEFKHPSYRQPLIINNTNELLRTYKGANGIKTGTTNAAGKCLVASASRNGRQLIAVSLKSGNRQGDCIRLLDYGFNECTLTKVVDSQTVFKQLRLINGKKAYADIYPAEDLFLWQGSAKTDIEKKVKLKYLLTAPISKGQKIGELAVYVDKQLVKNIDLLCGQSIGKKHWLLKNF